MRPFLPRTPDLELWTSRSICISRASWDRVAVKSSRARNRIGQKPTNWRFLNHVSLTEVIGGLICLEAHILAAVERYASALMPRCTHQQHFQLTTIDHYLNAYTCAATPDIDHLIDSYGRLDVSPLGCAAYFGTFCPGLKGNGLLCHC